MKTSPRILTKIREQICVKQKSVDKPSANAPLDVYRLLLVRVLRASGFRKICKDEPIDTRVWANKMSVGLLAVVLNGLVLYGIAEFDWSLFRSVLFVAGALFVCMILTALKFLSHMITYLSLFGLWLIAGFADLIRGDIVGSFLTLAVPFILVIAGRWTIRAVTLAINVPLFIPVALILILLPLLTEDPWRLAAAANVRLAWLACVLILPMAAVLIWRLGKTDVAPILKSALQKTEGGIPENYAVKLLQSTPTKRKNRLTSMLCCRIFIRPM